MTPYDLETAVAARSLGLGPGDAVVVWTERSQNYERPDFTFHRVFITKEGAHWIVARQPATWT